jgi:hypothetical protein
MQQFVGTARGFSPMDSIHIRAGWNARGDADVQAIIRCHTNAPVPQLYEKAIRALDAKDRP